MRLHSIKLTNFRQFTGEQEFVLEGEHDRPVSIIFGANGAGKTTLLNAFTWVLYGEMSEDVELQQRMVTDSVYASAAYGDYITVAAELVLDHEGEVYRIRRSAEARKESDEQRTPVTHIEMWVLRRDGASEVVEYPQPKIDSILPKRLARFFFFNGERIEKLVQKHSYAEVRQDIKTLLGLEQVERALDHLPRVERKLSAELRKHGGERAADIQERIDELREQETTARENLTILNHNLASYTEERDTVLDLLRQHESAAPLQKERDRIHRELDEAKSLLNAARVERDKIVGEQGFLAFTEDLVTRTVGMAAALHERGAIPAPLKREFVDELISQRRCICGTALDEHSEPLHNVEVWRRVAQHFSSRRILRAISRSYSRDGTRSCWAAACLSISARVSRYMQFPRHNAAVSRRIGSISPAWRRSLPRSQST
jgi:DNA sulfur modification protein DndD